MAVQDGGVNPEFLGDYACRDDRIITRIHEWEIGSVLESIIAPRWITLFGIGNHGDGLP
jgi:hypothetical protein